MLQCVRYIVKTRFLGVGQSDLHQTSTQTKTVELQEKQAETQPVSPLPMPVVDDEVWEDGVL